MVPSLPLLSCQLSVSVKENPDRKKKKKKSKNLKSKLKTICYDVLNINDPVERAIQKYKKHTSIQMIKETFDNDKTFSFDFVSPDIIFKEIVSLDTNKSTHSNNVPTEIVKANC